MSYWVPPERRSPDEHSNHQEPPPWRRHKHTATALAFGLAAVVGVCGLVLFGLALAAFVSSFKLFPNK